MERVEAALREGRCAIVVSPSALTDAATQMGVQVREGLPIVHLGGGAGAAVPLGRDALGPAFAPGGGVLVLVEPNPATDGPALNQLAALVEASPNKPRLFMVAKAFNPFMFPGPLRLLRLVHLKLRPRDFVLGLPMPVDVAPPPPPPTAEAPAAQESRGAPRKAAAGPRLTLIGREEESAALGALLEAPGPAVVLGEYGVGRRWLIESVLAAREGLVRWPDFSLARGVGFSAFAGRIAEGTGHRPLQDALKGATAPARLVDLCVEALALASMADRVMVVHGLEYHQGRDGALVRDDRLGMLLRALLTRPYAAHLLFRTTRRPLFHDASGATLPVLQVGGLKGRELYGIWESWHGEEVSREHMGPLHQRTLGHPMAVRAFALAWMSVDGPAEERDKLFERKKFLRLTPGNVEPLRAELQRVVDGLPEDLRKLVAGLAHLPEPTDATLLADLGLSKTQRNTLLALGVLEGLPHGCRKAFYVHPLVRSVLSAREVSDFSLLEEIGGRMIHAAEKLGGVDRLALQQDANRMLVEARRTRNRVALPYPDEDATGHAVRGMLKGRQPRVDLAEQRLEEALRVDPHNPELAMLKAELLAAKGAEKNAVNDLLKSIQQATPTPELFHAQASLSLDRKGGLVEAMIALERGAAVFPQDARLKRRLGGLYRQANRLDDAERVLREAMDLEPTMPDTYSLLGQILAERGPAHAAAAEELLREALRLDPEGAITQERLASVLHRRGLADPDAREAAWNQALELLEACIRGGASSGHAHLAAGLLLLDRISAGLEAADEKGAAERADWFLRKAGKLGRFKVPLALGMARAAARLGRHDEAQATLDRLGPVDDVHLAFAQAEVHTARGRIFRADKALTDGWHKLPEHAPERVLFKKLMDQLRAIIESGQAAAIEDAADQAAAEAAMAAPPPDRGGRRDRGQGSGGRRRRGGPNAEAAPEEEAVTAAPETEGAVVVAEDEDDAPVVGVGLGEVEDDLPRDEDRGDLDRADDDGAEDRGDAR